MRCVSLLVVCLLLAPVGSHADEDENVRGFLERPPVFIDNEPDFPLAGMGPFVPRPGKVLPDYDGVKVESDAFRRDGENVQPALNVRFETMRIGVLAGVAKDWAAGISIPWQQTEVRGQIGGMPASVDSTALGDITLLAKKRVWSGPGSDTVVITAGIELPTGKDDMRFDEDNAITNAYYRGYPKRLPLSWQPGSGSVDGFLAASYGSRKSRFSYAALIGTKLHTSGDEDVKIGDIFIAGLNGTYGIGKRIAFSLGFTLRVQGDDDYPQAPPPGVNQPALAGTTTHGATLFINPSVRFNIGGKVVVGLGLRYPAIKPDDGFVPETQGFIIIYPSL